MDTTEHPVIVNNTIGTYPRPMPKEMFDKMPEVRVQLSNGENKILFDFFHDEISFSESEFIGLTEESEQRLKFEKDKRYIQS